MAKRVFKITLWTLLIVLLLLTGFAFALRLPSVQTAVVHKITDFLSSELKTKVTIGSVDFVFFKTFRFHQLYVEDEKQDTLLYVDKLDAAISLLSINDQKIRISKVTLAQGLFNLKRFKERKGLNLDIITDYFADNDTTPSKKKPWDVALDNIKVENIDFRYNDYRWDDFTPLVDFDDIKVDNFNAELSDFYLHDSVYFNAENISFREQKGFAIEKLNTKVGFTDSILHCDELTLKTAQSNVHGQIAFLFDRWEDFEEFIEKVRIQSSFTSSILSSNDLAFFARELKGLNKIVTVQGDVKGTIDRLRGRNMIINYGAKCVMAGNIAMSGLPDIEQTYIEADLKKLVLNQKEIETIPQYPFYENEKIEIPQWLAKAGDLKFKGHFTGYIYDFVTYGNIETALGNLSADVNLKLDTDNEKYSGNVSANEFDIGTLFDAEDVLGRTTFNLNVKGKYFDINKMNAEVEGNIAKLHFNKYDYSNVDIKGSVAKKLFNGFLNVNEDNLGLVFNGKVDFNQAKPIYDFEADIDHLKPYALHLLKGNGNGEFGGNVKMDFEGDNIDNMNGIALLRDVSYLQDGKVIEIDSLSFVSTKYKDKYNISLKSDLIDASVDEVKKLSTAYYSLWNTITSYVPTLKPYEKKIFDENCQFEINIKNLDPVFNIFYPPLHIAPGTALSGEINSMTKHIDLFLSSPFVTWNDMRCEGLAIKGVDIKGKFDFVTNMQNFFLAPNIPIEKVTIDGNSDNQSAYIKLAIHDVDTATNKLVFAFNSEFRNDGITSIHIEPSTLVKVDTMLWKFNDENSTIYDANGFTFNNVVLKSNYFNKIAINGNVGGNAAEPLRFLFKDFDVRPLNKLLVVYDVEFGGVLNGNVNLMGLNDKPLVNGNLFIKDFAFFKDSIGDANIVSDYNSKSEVLHLEGNVMRHGDSTLTFDGDYRIGEKDDYLDFDVSVQKIQLSTLQHYFDGLVSNLTGRGTGKLKISGTAKTPIITGKALVQKGKFTIDYLNTRYSLSDEIDFKEKYIGFNNIEVFDSLGNKGMVSGKLYHKFFDDIKFDIHIDANNLLMMNTHAGQNDLFYGKAFATGKVDLTGTPDLTAMQIKLRTEKNTQINIPLSTPEEVSENDLITFEKHGAVELDKKENKSSLSGFDIDFEMDVTEDAIIKLIFDEKVGDVIAGQGKGNLKLEITPDGAFNMFGEYTISKGDYFFTLQNIAGKPFKLVKGSTIRWNGDPYQATIDIKALYTKPVSLADLLPDDSAAFARKVPVNVVLNLKNNLFTPDVTFDIEVPNVDAATSSRIKRYIDTDDEKNKQVMSIIFLNKFQLPSALQGTQTVNTGGNSGLSSLTEFLSKQLSDWVSQINKNVDINLSYTPGDVITSEQYNVLVSTQLLQDRLILNTNVGVNGSGGNENSANNSIVGEFDIEYVISKNGNFRVKAFNESNANSLINTNQAPYTQGVGLSYRQEFTRYRELISKKKKNKTNSK